MTTDLNPTPTPTPEGREDPHRSLHSEAGALRGEHTGRSRDPLVKVAGLAWLEFEKPDLDKAEQFGADLRVHRRRPQPEDAVLRGRRPQRTCLVVHRGRSRVSSACVPGGRAGGPGPAGPQHRRHGRRAPRRAGRPAEGPQRVPGARVHGVPELQALPERARYR